MNATIPAVEERQIKQESGADALLSLEELIRNQLRAIEKLTSELKDNREMFTDSFTNNPVYHEHEQKVKEVTKAKNSVKAEILKQPSVALLDQKVKDIRFDINEKRKTLSDLLLDYKQQTGATQLELFDGQTLEIIQSARLVRATGK